MTALTRIYRFSASHRLHSPALSEHENNRVYGKCNHPFGHGHDYTLEVTVAGAVDSVTGRVLPVAMLDRLVEETILRRFSHCNLNLDIRELTDLVPTTENVAITIAKLLEQHWPACSARLTRVHIQETGRNSFEVLLPMEAPRAAPQPELENVHV
jgi:6-pyruvoyltetrahydropterin/6-carboxytetrahydropterin synthase